MYGLSKKKMPYLYPIDEAIGLLNNEIRLVEWRIKYPEQFKSHFNKQPFSPLYLADKTNLIDIMEIINIGGNQCNLKFSVRLRLDQADFLRKIFRRYGGNYLRILLLLFGSSVGILFIKFILIHVFVCGVDEVVHQKIVIPVADLEADCVA